MATRYAVRVRYRVSGREEDCYFDSMTERAMFIIGLGLYATVLAEWMT